MLEPDRRPSGGDHAPLTVLDCKPILRGAEVLVQANHSSSVIVDSFLGSRRFYLRGGDRIRIKVKTRTWPPGYQLTLRELVFAARDWTKIPWRWS